MHHVMYHVMHHVPLWLSLGSEGLLQSHLRSSNDLIYQLRSGASLDAERLLEDTVRI